jgi:hypothetical protein
MSGLFVVLGFGASIVFFVCAVLLIGEPPAKGEILIGGRSSSFKAFVPLRDLTFCVQIRDYYLSLPCSGGHHYLTSSTKKFLPSVLLTKTSCEKLVLQWKSRCQVRVDWILRILYLVLTMKKTMCIPRKTQLAERVDVQISEPFLQCRNP